MLIGVGQKVDGLRENKVNGQLSCSDRNLDEIRREADQVQKWVQDYNKSRVDAKRQSTRL
ncbi:hypothetical protein CVS40_9650 [Lucilia cuprina]|nr:hypothetical protein CVS40_9650 [Lucilia cuprina]